MKLWFTTGRIVRLRYNPNNRRWNVVMMTMDDDGYMKTKWYGLERAVASRIARDFLIRGTAV